MAARKTKVLVVTADFKPGTETIQEHYGRIVNAVLRGEIKPATDSPIECYCDTCKKVYAGTWVEHQQSWHGRDLFKIERETQEEWHIKLIAYLMLPFTIMIVEVLSWWTSRLEGRVWKEGARRAKHLGHPRNRIPYKT